MLDTDPTLDPARPGDSDRDSSSVIREVRVLRVVRSGTGG